MQLVAQRRFSVAEEAIVAVAMASYALDWARNGGSYEGEGSTRTPTERESEEVKKIRDSYFTAVERLRTSEQRFADLEKIALLARHHLGETAYESFNTLLRARNRVMISAGMLIKTTRNPDIPIPASLQENRQRWEDDVWGGGDPSSPLTIKVQEAETALREICDREARMTAAIWPFRTRDAKTAETTK